MNEMLSYLSDNNLWFLTQMNENLLSREDPEKDLVTRAFRLLYGEFDKITYMSHWSGDHRPTGTNRMLYRWIKTYY